jgi:methylated-DNA-protein-cysteine methyltransferase-like protein
MYLVNIMKRLSKNKSDSFFLKVYDVARKIPFGRVTTYGAIARYLGATRSSRMVGWAMHQCGSVYPPIPAHRVVNRTGLLTGKHHFGSVNLMQELLESEGIEVVDNRIANFDKLLWTPGKKQGKAKKR